MISDGFATSPIACRSASIHPAIVVVYLHADPMHDEFRDFLQRHAPLLERLPAWTIRIVVPAHMEGSAQGLQKAVWGQLASPLQEPILTELRWYLDRFAIPPTEANAAGDRVRFDDMTLAQVLLRREE